MKQIIGFANCYYTLWNYAIFTRYIQDSYGNYHPASNEIHYYYLKNISKSFDKVVSNYPHLVIDEGLRGKSRDFVVREQVKLPEDYFWKGKYKGKWIDEIIQDDFDYCLWYVDNMSDDSSRYICSHSRYKQHILDKQLAVDNIISNSTLLSEGQSAVLNFKTNGYNAYYSNNGEVEYLQSSDEDAERYGYDRCTCSASYGNIDVQVISGVKQIGGIYPYLMPIINGKAMRTKGKDINVTIHKVIKTEVVNGCVNQLVEVII